MAREFVMQSEEVICERLSTLGLNKKEDIIVFNHIAKSARIKKGVKPFVEMFLEAFKIAYKSPTDILANVYLMDDFANALIDDEEFKMLVKENAKSLAHVLYVEIFGG